MHALTDTCVVLAKVFVGEDDDAEDEEHAVSYTPSTLGYPSDGPIAF